MGHASLKANRNSDEYVCPVVVICTSQTQGVWVGEREDWYMFVHVFRRTRVCVSVSMSAFVCSLREDRKSTKGEEKQEKEGNKNNHK